MKKSHVVFAILGSAALVVACSSASPDPSDSRDNATVAAPAPAPVVATDAGTSDLASCDNGTCPASLTADQQQQLDNYFGSDDDDEDVPPVLGDSSNWCIDSTSETTVTADGRIRPEDQPGAAELIAACKQVLTTPVTDRQSCQERAACTYIIKVGAAALSLNIIKAGFAGIGNCVSNLWCQFKYSK
jgi:hypothetical protein